MAVINPATRLALLRRVSILRGLTKEELFTVARQAAEVGYSAGMTVVRRSSEISPSVWMTNLASSSRTAFFPEPCTS